jgi:hypothetical protein
MRLLVGIAAAAAVSTPPYASFRPAPGWIVARAGVADPGLVVAVTARDAGVLHPFGLFDSFTKLSPRGAIVWAATIGRRRPGFPLRTTWPPRLSTFRVDRGFEGQPAPNIQQRVWVGDVRGWDMDVRVFFATQHPSAELLAAAEAELRRLRLPR